MTNNLIEVKNLKKYYQVQKGFIETLLARKIDFIKAVDKVSFNIRKGEVFGLAGESGSGKTTTGRLILGLTEPTEGKIFFDGREVLITSPRVSKQLGIEMVYQNFALCPNLDVPSNLFLGREITTRSFFSFLRKRKMEKEAVEVLHRLKIDIKNPRIYIDRLSGGQQQAVAIGKAVSFYPKLVIMDEPTANLALVEIDKVLELTLRLKQHDISIIFISHRLDDVFTVSDRIFVLKHGRKVDVKEKAKTNKDEVIRLMFM
ncbi:Fructose import ATP-binding protein FrcA [subsurface metagenome]